MSTRRPLRPATPGLGVPAIRPHRAHDDGIEPIFGPSARHAHTHAHTHAHSGGAVVPARVAVVVGTRPEAIKMAPVVHELRGRANAFSTRVIATSQHRELLSQALGEFGLVADVDLDLMEPGQSLGRFAARCLAGMTDTLARERPSMVLVQGDTTTVTATAMAAAYLGIPVGHVEAGLRSHDTANPFPEELNRRMASSIASLHFAPTPLAYRNLMDEGISPDCVVMSGNTIVDAVGALDLDGVLPPSLASLPADRTIVLTSHRRENHGAGLERICAAVRELVERRPTLHVVLPMHPHPAVREAMFRGLGSLSQVHLIEPLAYRPMLALLSRARLILTDSGGIQEEAPSLRKPVLILRETTERPEVLSSGAGKLVGTDPRAIVAATLQLLDDAAEYARMTSGRNPFGDGRASGRIAESLELFLHGRRVNPRLEAAFA